MKRLLNLSTIRKQASYLLLAACTVSIMATSSTAMAASAKALIDDFSNETNNSWGLPRQQMADTMVGGGSTSEANVKNGIMQLSGEIVPPRGQPGWVSTVLLLDGEGKPVNVSEYSGIRMSVKVSSGALSLSANSTDVTNFDYHSSAVMVVPDGKFHDVDIPFDSLKRMWSEQTPLNAKTIASLSIVAFSLKKAPFDYEIDEISFY